MKAPAVLWQQAADEFPDDVGVAGLMPWDRFGHEYEDLSYLQKGVLALADGAKETADVLRELVAALEDCDLTYPDEERLAPIVERAMNVLGMP